MSDWDRVLKSCKIAGLNEPEDMFDISECINSLYNKIKDLKLENDKLKKHLANGVTMKFNSEKEFIDHVDMIHRQNLKDRNSSKQDFIQGIEACLEELKDLNLFSIPYVSRFLIHGELIKEGDEVLNENAQWEKTECSGEVYDELDHCQHRRKPKNE